MKVDGYIRTFPAPLVAVFRDWLHTGYIPNLSAMGSTGTIPPGLGTMGQFVSAHCRLDKGEERETVATFLQRRVLVVDGRQRTVRESLADTVKHMLPWMLDTVVERLDDSHWEDYEALKAFGRNQLLERGVEDFAEELVKIVEAEVGDLTVFELFRRRRHDVGFASCSAYSTEMLSAATEVAEPPLGRFHLYVHRETDGGPPDAFEWVAGVKGPEPEEWRAVASGMVYVFGPDSTRGNRSAQLLAAADEVSSGDEERARAFLSAHSNADQILAKGDIAFVWEWERRHGTAPGEGVECLAAVCGQLRKRHKRLKSIVISISPERFAPRAANEPAVIAEARLADLDKLHAYLSTIGQRLGLAVYVTASDQNDIT